MTMSAKRPSRRKMVGEPDFLGDAHDVAEFDHGLVAGHAVGRDRRRGQTARSRTDRVSAVAPRSRSGCGPRRGANSRPRCRRTAPGSCHRRRAVRRRRTPGDPGRSRCAGAGAARRSNRRCRRCRAPTRRSFSVRRPPRAGSPSSGRRPRPAASPAPAGRAALRPRGRPCRPARSTSSAARADRARWRGCARSRSPRGARLRLQFAELGQFADIIMPHQPVEVERRRRAGIGLDRADFRQLPRHHRRSRTTCARYLPASRPRADRPPRPFPTCCRTAAA